LVFLKFVIFHILTGPNGAVETLNTAIEASGKSIGQPYGQRRNIVLMLPYPHITQGDFGSLSGAAASLDFTTRTQNLMQASAQRLDAAQWMVDQIVDRWSRKNLTHVHLLGVYWMFETVYRGWDVDDHWLLKELKVHINQKGLKFLWIPFWSSYNVHLLDDYQKYYFDLAFIQPNHMFYRNANR
jgi:hypothetical protein